MINRRMRWILTLGAALLFASVAPGAETRPNIVLIVADDLGYGDLGCYGSRVNPTPNIDALAAGGLRLTDFHSAGAMCSPTRASILTGCYPQRFGAQFDSALSGSEPGSGLPLEAETIAELLAENGYATSCFGKWHLGYRAPLLPTRQGFGTFRGLLSGDGDYHTRVDRSGTEDWWSDETARKESGYTTDLLTDHGIEFIEAHRDEPFFLYLPHLAIHFPWQGREDPPHRVAGTDYDKGKWGIIPDPSNVAPHVRSMIEALDESVGRIIASLDRFGLRDNTLVVFTSDNGGYVHYGERFSNISSNGPLRGQKVDLYEGGHRVPMILSWPGRIEPGVTEATAHSNDFFPTFLSVAGISEETSHDGIDLSDLAFEGVKLPERTLFWRSKTQKAVRRGPWKLCVTGKKRELFDLSRDPGETTDLSKKEPGIATELAEAWETWASDVNRSADSYASATP